MLLRNGLRTTDSEPSGISKWQRQELPHAELSGESVSLILAWFGETAECAARRTAGADSPISFVVLCPLSKDNGLRTTDKQSKGSMRSSVRLLVPVSSIIADLTHPAYQPGGLPGAFVPKGQETC